MKTLHAILTPIGLSDSCLAVASENLLKSLSNLLMAPIECGLLVERKEVETCETPNKAFL